MSKHHDWKIFDENDEQFKDWRRCSKCKIIIKAEIYQTWVKKKYECQPRHVEKGKFKNRISLGSRSRHALLAQMLQDQVLMNREARPKPFGIEYLAAEIAKNPPVVNGFASYVERHRKSSYGAQYGFRIPEIEDKPAEWAESERQPVIAKMEVKTVMLPIGLVFDKFKFVESVVQHQHPTFKIPECGLMEEQKKYVDFLSKPWYQRAWIKFDEKVRKILGL